MTSFIPGNKSYAKRMINYNAVYNRLNANSLNSNLAPSKKCECIPQIFNKSNNNSSSFVSNNISYNGRIAQIINSSLGGKTQYGNFYLGQPMQVNCFGRSQGMPGGYGSPPVNKF
jgi:hypothetical protein